MLVRTIITADAQVMVPRQTVREAAGRLRGDSTFPLPATQRSQASGQDISGEDALMWISGATWQ